MRMRTNLDADLPPHVGGVNLCALRKYNCACAGLLRVGLVFFIQWVFVVPSDPEPCQF